MTTMQDKASAQANEGHVAHPTAKAEGSSHGSGPHVVSLKLLVGVFVALLALTWVTVAVTAIDAGPLNVWIALAVAVVKGMLVVLYFMHLRWDSPFNALIVAVSLLFVGIFVGATIHDTLEYHHRLTPPEQLQRVE